MHCINCIFYFFVQTKISAFCKFFIIIKYDFKISIFCGCIKFFLKTNVNLLYRKHFTWKKNRIYHFFPPPTILLSQNNIRNRRQRIKINKVHYRIISFNHWSCFSIFFRFRQIFCLVIQKPHHRFVRNFQF